MTVLQTSRSRMTKTAFFCGNKYPILPYITEELCLEKQRTTIKGLGTLSTKFSIVKTDKAPERPES